MGRYAISCHFLTKRGTNKLEKGSKKHFRMSYLTILSILCFFMIFEKTFWSPELYHIAQQYIQRQHLDHVGYHCIFVVIGKQYEITT